MKYKVPMFNNLLRFIDLGISRRSGTAPVSLLFLFLWIYYLTHSYTS